MLTNLFIMLIIKINKIELQIKKTIILYKMVSNYKIKKFFQNQPYTKMIQKHSLKQLILTNNFHLKIKFLRLNYSFTNLKLTCQKRIINSWKRKIKKKKNQKRKAKEILIKMLFRSQKYICMILIEISIRSYLL